MSNHERQKQRRQTCQQGVPARQKRLVTPDEAEQQPPNHLVQEIRAVGYAAQPTQPSDSQQAAQDTKGPYESVKKDAGIEQGDPGIAEALCNGTVNGGGPGRKGYNAEKQRGD